MKNDESVNGGKPVVPPKLQEMPAVGEPKEIDGIRKENEVGEVSELSVWSGDFTIFRGAWRLTQYGRYGYNIILGIVKVDLDLWSIDSILDAC
jgi:hypothetical protein